ncbi:MAG: serine hydrolase [Pseudomonadota bacterium]
MKWVKRLGAFVFALFVAAFGYLLIAPPDLLRVGSNYTAKMVCSNVFTAGRDADEVLAIDVQAPGHPLLRLMRVNVDRSARTVEAGIFGFIAPGMAVLRGPGLGCSSLPTLDYADMVAVALPEKPAQNLDAPWPAGSAVDIPVNETVEAILDDEALTGPGMRAVVVVKDGQIIGERYGDGFSAQTPLLGWSVTKTVTGALIGRAIREGHVTRDAPITAFDWTDERAGIALSDLMGMATDLTWNEGYGSVSDVTRMLYLEPDMAGFVASQPVDAQSPEGIGDSFNYSSGTTVLLSSSWQNGFDDPAAAAAFPYEALFEPLGMASAVLEMDAAGTYVGSSYMYATARDWAKFGQFMRQRGVWNGRSLLPVGYVDWMVTPHSAADGQYGQGQVWLRAANAWMPGANPALPDDGFYMNGHDGQSISVIPSEDLVVVRLGLTPTDQIYKVANLVSAIINATAD